MDPISIQGVGVVSPFGINSAEAFSKFYEKGDISTCPDRLDIVPKIQIRDYLAGYQKEVPDIRYMDAVAKKAIIAASGAMHSAGISDDAIHHNPYRYGIMLATKNGPAATRRKLYESLAARNGNSVSATLFSNCGYNIAASLVAVFLGAKGVNLTLSGSPNIGLSILKRASHLLGTRRADTLFIGFSDCSTGADCSSPVILADSTCVLCIKGKQGTTEKVNGFDIEYLEQKDPDWQSLNENPLAPGIFYGIRNSQDSKGEPSLQKLDFSLSEKIALDHDYLLFLQLGFLMTNSQAWSGYKAIIIPVQAGNGVAYLKASIPVN